MCEFNVFRGVQVGGLVGFYDGHEKKKALKGRGSVAKNIGFKGGGLQKNSPKFCSDGICNNANNLPESQKPESSDFPG